jgi:hypothetical protein
VSLHDPGSVRAASYRTEHMFQSSKKRLRAWMALAEEALGAAPPADARLEPRAWAMHPHRRRLRWQRERRGGSVPAAPAHCLCPVRPARGAGRRVKLNTP